jgi:hypothetical protein
MLPEGAISFSAVSQNAYGLALAAATALATASGTPKP